MDADHLMETVEVRLDPNEVVEILLQEIEYTQLLEALRDYIIDNKDLFLDYMEIDYEGC